MPPELDNLFKKMNCIVQLLHAHVTKTCFEFSININLLSNAFVYLHRSAVTKLCMQWSQSRYRLRNDCWDESLSSTLDVVMRGDTIFSLSCSNTYSPKAGKTWRPVSSICLWSFIWCDAVYYELWALLTYSAHSTMF